MISIDRKYLPILKMLVLLAILAIGQLSEIEFINESLRNLYDFIMIISLLISSFFCMIKVSYWENIILKLITAFVFISLGLGSFIFVLGQLVCGISEEILFVNSKQPGSKIVARSYGCGAYDSDFPEYKTFEVYRVNNLFNYVTEFDTTKADMRNWKRVNE
ncbi:MAG: hypothetical protein ABI861_00940 [Panacibacter sp.]